jgi:hypothetical protein
MGGGSRRQAMGRSLVKVHRLENERANLYRQLGKQRERLHRTKDVDKVAGQIAATTIKIRAKTKKINAAHAERTKRQALATMAGISILRDTGTLLAALLPTFQGVPGSLEEMIDGGIRVGYGGPGAHPKGKATIADIASFHQIGSGRLPRRPIIVATPAPVKAAMAADMEKALAQIAKDTGNT